MRDIYIAERLYYHKPGIRVFSGYEESFLATLSVGGGGVVGSLVSFLAPVFRRIRQTFESGRVSEARKLQGKINQFIEAAHLIGMAPATRGWLNLLGVNCGPCKGEKGCLSLEEWGVLIDCLEAFLLDESGRELNWRPAI